MVQLLGKEIKIVDSTNKSLVHLSGVVVDETKNSVVLKTQGKLKRVVKDAILFTLDGETIDGKSICVMPQDRLKLKWKQK